MPFDLKWGREELTKIESLYGRIPVSQIAEQMGTTDSAIHNLAHRYDWKSSLPGFKSRISLIVVKELIDFGCSANEIGVELGCNGRHIRWLSTNKLDSQYQKKLRDNGRSAQRMNNNKGRKINASKTIKF